MNSKLLLAFVTGAVVASGLMLIVVKRVQAPEPAPPPLRIATPAVPAAPPIAATAPAPPPPAAAPVAEKKPEPPKPTHPARVRKFIPPPPEAEQAEAALPEVIKEAPL